MTVLKLTVEDTEVDAVKQMLTAIPSIKAVEEEGQVQESSALTRIKKILDDARGKELFKDIEDPSEWQRQIRKEWDRDF